MKLKIILIISIFPCYFGGIFSAITFYTRNNDPKIIIAILLIIITNLFSAKYLYDKTKKNNAEWALFGLLGNINAIAIYWIYNLVTSKWSKKENLIK